MADIQIFVLGGFTLSYRNSTISLSSKKLRGLLCFLAITQGQFHQRGKLAALFWRDGNDQQSRQNLRQALAQLRKAIPFDMEQLLVDGELIGLQKDTVWVDALEYADLCKNADQQSLTQAIELYQGEIFEGINCRSSDFEQWLEIERQHMRHNTVNALDQLLQLQKARDYTHSAVLTGKRLINIDPMNEEFHREVMELLVKLDKHNEAIQQYRECEKILHHGLGISPAQETRSLYQRILQQRNGPEMITDNIDQHTSQRTAETFSQANEEIGVLVVDDDKTIRQVLSTYLSKSGYRVVTAADGKEMRNRLAQHAIDIVLLDIGLPGEDGLTLTRYIRQNHDIAIIMVTAADEVVDRVIGLELGADDYVAKPFDPRELRARLKNVVRHYRPKAADHKTEQQISAGTCTLNLQRRQLFDHKGNVVPVSNLEYELLLFLVQNPFRIWSRDDLVQKIQNRPWDPNDRSIDIRILRLRQKIEENPENPLYIKTARGQGYMYVPQNAEKNPQREKTPSQV